MKRMMHPNPLQWTHVYSKTEEEVLRKAGWVDDVPVVAEVPPAEPDKADLIAALEAKGVRVDGRKSKAGLIKELEKA